MGKGDISLVEKTSNIYEATPGGWQKKPLRFTGGPANRGLGGRWTPGSALRRGNAAEVEKNRKTCGRQTHSGGDHHARTLLILSTKNPKWTGY